MSDHPELAILQSNFFAKNSYSAAAFWAGAASVGVLFCFPYAMKGLKDINHYCGNCGVLLATWHRSGAQPVDVHQYSSLPESGEALIFTREFA